MFGNGAMIFIGLTIISRAHPIIHKDLKTVMILMSRAWLKEYSGEVRFFAVINIVFVIGLAAGVKVR
jgi:hypothetical protein